MLKALGLRSLLRKIMSVGGGAAATANAETAATSVKQGAKPKLARHALMLAYQGKNYFGMQIQNDMPTIEGHLLRAMRIYGMINEKEEKSPYSFFFQRAARTDRSVSAVRQVCSMMLPKNDAFVSEGPQKLNEHLPRDIRVVGVRRTTPSFHAQKKCDSRTYSYTLPTYAFAELDKLTNSAYRLSDERIAEINDLLKCFIGTHNFFNYTARREYADQSCNRYMMSFECDKPILYKDPIRGKDVEFMSIYIRGQSFMLHQIRKMIGMVIAIMRGFVYKTDIQKTFESQRMDVPKAPGLGLLLERLHYTNYDRNFASTHAKLDDWGEEVEAEVKRMRDELIVAEILSAECQSQSMMMWLSGLPLHNFACDAEDKEGESVSNLSAAAALAGGDANLGAQKVLADDVGEALEQESDFLLAAAPKRPLADDEQEETSQGVEAAEAMSADAAEDVQPAAKKAKHEEGAA